jgi:N-glycosylase/DNA lyase
MLPPFGYSDTHPIHLTRVQRLSDGTITKITVEAGEGQTMRVTSSAHVNNDQQAEIGRVVSRCLSFEQDLNSFYTLLRDKPGYDWVEKAGAGRLLVSPTVWEDLAKILLTTNTTWNMTRQMVSRLVSLGEPSDKGHVFPTPEQIAARDVDSFSAHVRAGYRGAYLHQLASSIAEGQVDVESWYTDQTITGEALYRHLKALKGFGDYAAGSMMRLLERFDQLGLDSVCRDMFAKRHNGGIRAPDSAIKAYYDPFGEWRGLAVWIDVMREELAE